MKTNISELKAGDYIELENDPYADPHGAHQEYIYEYAVVAAVEREAADCIAVTLESGDVIGFPPTHKVYVSRA